MLWLAGLALAGGWLVHQLPGVPVPAWLGFATPVLGLAAWWLWGGRAGVVVLLCGWALVRAQSTLEDRWPEALAGADVRVRGTVCEFPRRDPEAIRFVLVADADPLQPSLPRRLHLSWYDLPPGVAPGERWQLVVRLKPPRGLSNPGAFDFEQWLYLRGIGATGYVRPSPSNRPLPPAALACPIGKVRAQLAGHISTILAGHRAAPYVVGVAVGATHGLQETDWELLRRTGTTHLMAISGLNIAMIVVPILLLGRVAGRVWPALGIRWPAGAGLAPALLAAACYSALAGFEVSTVRALVMLLVAALLTRRGRSVRGPELLGAAAVAILALDPFAVLSAGFWLSFAGVGWLLLAGAGLRRGGAEPDGVPGQGRSRALLGHVATFSRAQVLLGLGLAPLTIAWFAQVSLVAPFTNLLAVPIFSFLIMPITLAGTALLPVGGGPPLLALGADVLELLLRALEQVAASPLTLWQPPPVNAAGLACAGAAVLVICWPRPMPLRWAGSVGLLPLLAGTGSGPDEGDWRVVVLDVGQGLSVLVQTAHHALLYDAGPAFRSRDAGTSVVLPALRALGVRQLDALLISHDDADHRGGAGAVLKAFPAATLIAGAPGRFDLRSFRRCDTGAGWTWDGVQFRLVGAGATPRTPTSDNDASCLLSVSGGGGGLLLPGDIGARREAELVRSGLIAESDVVLAPHHGSRSSSGAAFVEATRPRYVVMSAGYRNRWGFPAAEVTQRWYRADACILSTADTGAMIFGFFGSARAQILHRQRIDGARLWTARPVGRPDCRRLEPAR